VRLLRLLPARVRACVPLAALALVVGLACGDDESTDPPPAPPEVPTGAAEPTGEPDAEAPVAVEPQAEGTVVARTVTPDGTVFEAEYGREGQLPRDFPEDVPLYGNAKPLSSVATPEHGTVVNLRSSDAPEALFDWYRSRYVEQGWEIEHEKAERGRSTVVARKGNRVSSVVIMGVPGTTQALLTVAEDR
jgi:hypothetical protein